MDVARWKKNTVCHRLTMSSIAVGALTLFPALARADGLRVSTAEAPSWPAAVAALQSDVHAEGRTIHVFIHDDSGRRLRCSEYMLQLDATATASFVNEGCDVASDSTVLRLVHRGALFAHGDVVARPLPVAITAIQVRTGGANGGAAAPGGSTVSCSIAVHPFLTDLERGSVVYLTPGRWVLRPHSASIAVDPATDGWVLRGSNTATLTVDYDVWDTQRNEVVLHDQATLACGVHAATPPPVAPSPSETHPLSFSSPANHTLSGNSNGACGGLYSTPDADPATVCADAPELQPGATVRGTTIGLADHFRASCALGAASPDTAYLLRVPSRAHVTLHLTSDFDGALYLRRTCGSPASEVACNDDAPDIRHSVLDLVLDGGSYYVVVDGNGSQCGGRNIGNYELTAWIESE